MVEVAATSQQEELTMRDKTQLRGPPDATLQSGLLDLQAGGIRLMIWPDHDMPLGVPWTRIP